MCGGADASATREVDTDVVATRSQLRLAGVDADPNEHRLSLRPLVLGERALRSRGRVQSLPSTIERDEKRVTLGVDLAAAVRGECLPQQAAVRRERFVVTDAEEPGKPGRPLDVPRRGA